MNQNYKDAIAYIEKHPDRFPKTMIRLKFKGKYSPLGALCHFFEIKTDNLIWKGGIAICWDEDESEIWLPKAVATYFDLTTKDQMKISELESNGLDIVACLKGLL